MSILFFINSLRKTDMYIEHIYLQGGCYKFHLLLSKLFKGCEPYITKNENHIVTKYKNKFYDIRGIVNNPDVRPLRKDEIKRVSKWSFQKHNLIQLHECPNCEEPLIYNYE